MSHYQGAISRNKERLQILNRKGLGVSCCSVASADCVDKRNTSAFLATDAPLLISSLSEQRYQMAEPEYAIFPGDEEQ